MKSMIIFNGKTYNSVEEMPDAEREAYQHIMTTFVDKNGNGIPDMLEGDMVKNVMQIYSTKLGAGGSIQKLDELPPEMRQKMESALQKLSQLGILNGLPAAAPLSSPQQSQPIAASTSSTPTDFNSTPIAQEDQGSAVLKWLLIGSLLMLCVIVVSVGAYFLLAGK